MSKENKITEEELKNLQELVAKLNSASSQLGNIEMQKHQLLHASQTLQSDMAEMQKALQETYGKVSVNMEDGTYQEIPEEVQPEVVE
jgi:Skp family chaperone for outer membrane proteins|tara:strand:+ start:400 stop:660 length:261 start_codon:yes stop_codon:yes gene_type:complete